MKRSLWLSRIVVLTVSQAVLSIAASAQTLGQGADDGVAIWRVVAALLLGVLLAVFLPVLLKARGGLLTLRLSTQRQGQLKLVESIRLSRNADLCLVECDGNRFLLAVAADGKIQRLPEKAEPGAEETA